MAVGEVPRVQPVGPAPLRRRRPPLIDKLVSGGQPGVDRAALDTALSLGIPCGGWCPKGRLAEDGPIPARYPLSETPSDRAIQRTEWNVRDSDATLVLVRGSATGGTRATIDFAQSMARPCHIVTFGSNPAPPAATSAWLRHHGVHILNVAGPRETQSRGIYRQARAHLATLLAPAPGA